MVDQFKAGEQIRCTVERVPQAAAAGKTIQRLMRRDPAIVRALRKAQDLRRQRMHVYVRGNRDWYSREKAARIARVVPGNSWTMTFTHDVAHDVASVQSYLKLEKA